MFDLLDTAHGGVLIVAEIGSNHNGDLDTALQLIDEAADRGADVCKFQSFLVDDLLAADDPNYERLRKLQLPREWYPMLMQRCHDRCVRFLSTATTTTTLEWMEADGAWGYKVASCNITHRPLLKRLVDLGKPLIVSTGMASLEEILELTAFFSAHGFSRYAVLHCTSQYPAPPKKMHLGNITELRRCLDCPVGLSDHSEGIHLAVAAVALGARIVEKHISLDKQGLGLDHEVAVLPHRFGAMCQAIRETEQALGVSFSPDAETCFNMRRSLHFARSLNAGHRLAPGDIKVVRPEDGLPPASLDQVIGRKLRRRVAIQQAVNWEDLDDNS